MMALKEKDLEKKTVQEIETMIQFQEAKSKEIANKVGAGKAKPTDMLTVNADLALLKKIHEKKVLKDNSRLGQQGQKKPAAPLKSYEDFMKNHQKK
jgi:hypothetical protein